MQEVIDDINKETIQQGEKLVKIEKDMGETKKNTTGTVKELEKTEKNNRVSNIGLGLIVAFAIAVIVLSIVFI